jgi:hypothetical protein
MNMPLALLNRRRRIGGFSPNALFALAEPGVWFDPSDLTTLFQDTAGTTPVTTTGQSVGLMLDKSKGLVLGSELARVTFDGTVDGFAAALGSVAAVGGALELTTSASNGYAFRDFATTVGTWYRITGKVRRVSGAGGVILKAATTSFTNIASGTSVVSSSFVDVAIYYLATTTTTRIYIQQDGAGAASVFALDDLVYRELPGNHAVQATTANRPTYGIHPFGGRRNLLVRTEEFDNGSWTKENATVTANAAVSPDGTTTAEKIIATAVSSGHGVYQGVATVTSSAYTLSAYFKSSEYAFASIAGYDNATFYATFDLTLGTVVNTSGLSASSITAVGNGWYRCTISRTATITGTSFWYARPLPTATYTSYTGDGTSGILVWGAQLELGSTATAYQRVTDQYNVTEAGVSSVSYLFFDGVNDSLATPTITPGVDKAQVFAGVRKLSDSAIRIVLETGTTGGNSSITLAAPRTSTVSYAFTSRGSSEGDARTGANTFVAPIANVLTGIGDIAGDNALVRVNGVQAGQSTADQGTGNYAAAAIYIGARNNAEFFFSGHLYGLIARFGPNLDTGQISSTETWVAGKTGITI